jgi:hypothetical protein
VKEDMRMYIFTFPRAQSRKIRYTLSSALLAAALLGLPLTAQDARTNRTGAQANLRISVNVVPAITPERHHKDNDKDKNRDHDAVSYDLTRRDEEVSISREVRSMLVEVQGGAQEQPVEMTTVVSK